MPRSRIPAATISRLSVYHRALAGLTDVEIVSSGDLSRLTGFSAAQIRRDLNYFGHFGTPGRGYPVSELRQRLEHILGIDRQWNVALIGVGHLGSALLSYQGFSERGFRVVAAFDNDPRKTGRRWKQLIIRHLADIGPVVRELDIRMAIIAVPAGAAREVLGLLQAAGIRGVLNFAPVRLNPPEGMHLVNVDLAAEMEGLSFFLLGAEALRQ